MLKSLKINNYALIESSEIDFTDGFTVITGETGAGKSILLGALGMLMGGKVEAKYFKDAEKKCVIEAVFDVAKYGLQSFFEENELDYEDETVVRKEIMPSGKARSFVNDTPVALTALKALGERLIDIHSQHRNLLIKDDAFQLSVVDAVGQTQNIFAEYSEKYSAWRRLDAELKALLQRTEDDEADKDYLIAQLEKLQSAAFKDGEQEELEKESAMLENAEEVRESISSAYWSIEEDETAANIRLKDAMNAMAKAQKFVPEMKELGERVESALLDLRDVSETLADLLEKVDVNPQRLEQVSQRLDTIYMMQRKHKVNTVAELLVIQADLEKRVAGFSSSGEDIELLTKKVKEAEAQLKAVASKLTEARKANTAKIAESIVAMLVQMGMPASRMEIEVADAGAYTPSGRDNVRFLFSANKDKTLMPISEIASGGEISRVMLALKCLLSEVQNLPTVILDEIDTGISGEVASRMGEVMQRMAQKMQVISITHLPQIASKGRTHFKVYKQDEGERIISHIKPLTDEERVDEIAQMVSGAGISEAARANARELLANK